jgi:hypothetical protein
MAFTNHIFNRHADKEIWRFERMNEQEIRSKYLELALHFKEGK